MKKKRKAVVVSIIIILLACFLVIIIYSINYNKIDIQQANSGWIIYDKSITNIKENMEAITEPNEVFDWWTLKNFDIEDDEYENTLNSLVASVRMCYLSYTDDGTLYTNSNSLREYRNKKSITRKELEQLNYSMYNEISETGCLTRFTQYNSLLVSNDENLRNEVHNITNKIADLMTNELFLKKDATYDELILRKIIEVHLVEDVSEFLIKEYNRLK